MADSTESSLISILKGSDSRGVYSKISNYLQPLTDARFCKNSKKAEKDLSLLRSLAKRFLPFLNNSLRLLPQRISEVSKSDGDGDVAPELFEAYRLCLDCLDTVASLLAGKPYSVDIQRIRMMRCLQECGRHKEAEIEGLRVLERFRNIKFGSKPVKSVGKFVPDVHNSGDDKEYASLVVEVVLSLVKSTAMMQSKEDGDYRRVLDMVREVGPWFRVLDASAYEKLHRVLVSYLGKCCLALVENMTCFDIHLLCSFCCTTLNEYAKSSMKHQVFKFARRVCSSLFTQQSSGSSVRTNTLICILDWIARESKIDTEDIGIELVEFVSFWSERCRTAHSNYCSTLSKHLERIMGGMHQVMKPLDLILRMYATGLHLYDEYNAVLRAEDLASFRGARILFLVRTSVDAKSALHKLPDLLGRLGGYFQINNDENYYPSMRHTNSFTLACLPQAAYQDTLLIGTEKNRENYLPLYLDALKFLCQPLAESVYSDGKHLVTESEVAMFMNELCIIQEAFQLLCGVILSFPRSMFNKEGDEFKKNIRTLSTVALASFTLSVLTKVNLPKSTRLIKLIIGSDLIQSDGLKCINSYLDNIGVVLYRNKQAKEASKALILCCRASWTCIEHLCKMYHKSRGFCDWSGDVILEYFNKECARSALLLDVLYQLNYQKMKKIATEMLDKWSASSDLFESLPAPVHLVKQWVKVQCKHNKDVEREDGSTFPCSLLSSSLKMSKRSVKMMLEQELTSYEEVGSVYPEICKQMQTKIADVLLQDVYVTPDSCLQKARTLVRKGRALRSCGIEGLQECILCLSEAIVTVGETYGETCNHAIMHYNHLAVAHCLRALCSQEAKPNSKIFDDIEVSIKLWSSIFDSDCYEKDLMISENIIILLYNIIDLLSLKGCVDYHHDLYRLMTRVFKLKSLPIEKCLTVLWECGRTTPALCVSPVNDAFIVNLADYCGEHSKSMAFWISSLRPSQTLLIQFQHNFSFLFAGAPKSSYDHGSSFCSDIATDEVKKTALELTSTDIVSSHSAFLAANLYHGLCARLVSNGRLYEALACAKEAHRLCDRLFKEKFMFTIERVEGCKEMEDFSQQILFNVKSLHVKRLVAREVLFFDSISWDLEECYHSPWNILKCYLEGTLQVGIIHENIGNGEEAEFFLQWGKAISCSQKLPSFMVAFSVVLGELYSKKRLWDLAESELQSAKAILHDSSSSFCCFKCKLILEATIDQNLGDLYMNKFERKAGDFPGSFLSKADNHYKFAEEKLNSSEWRNCVSCPENSNIKCSSQYDKVNAMMEKSKMNMVAKQCRRTKKAAKLLPEVQSLLSETNTRVTRSRYRSSLNKPINMSSESDFTLSEHWESNGTSGFSDMACVRDSTKLKSGGVALSCQREFCKKMRCWQCLPCEVMESGLVSNFIYLKWEFIRRKLLLKLLTSRAKCLAYYGQIHETHEALLQSISVLVSRNPFHHASSSTPLDFLLDLVGKEMQGDVFTVERGLVIHDICWFSLKSYPLKDGRTACCDFACIHFPKLVSLLKLAFVLCREIPAILQKVSKLLAIMYTLSTSSEHLSLSSFTKVLMENYWASFFHQASIGTNLNSQFFSHLIGKFGVQLADAEGSHVTGVSCHGGETCNLLRLAPGCTQDLEKYVSEFFMGVPSTMVICISFFGCDYASLLQDLLYYPAPANAWMLISRLSSKSQPIVFLLPLDSILEESSDVRDISSALCKLSKGNQLCKQWKCPWDSTVVDNVVPAFKMILEENYLSSSVFSLDDTEKNRALYWMWRKKLDSYLGNLLRNLEDSWFGSLKCMLLGECLNCKQLDVIHMKLLHDLKSKCKLDVNEDLLKVILGGLENMYMVEISILEMCLKKGCCIARTGHLDEARCSMLSDPSNGFGKSFEMALQFLKEAVNTHKCECSLKREPIILVLDHEVQMLPWENLPILRSEEVYRMPSVSCVIRALDRCKNGQGQNGHPAVSFPWIDPLDAFFVLNPSGDLGATQLEFENWFRGQNFEGKAGSEPTAEELSQALKSHDLFIYLGHGSGTQYISRHEIQKLENCAASLLMGCSSGSLKLNGSYVPHGPPLSYLLAGSPAIIANLWEVTDKDIDRFGKSMLDSWLIERSNLLVGCFQCSSIVEEFEFMSLRSYKGKARKRVSKKKSDEICEVDSHKGSCEHRPKIGSFMSQARNACKLPFLTGASPVCYGVPTGISRKN